MGFILILLGRFAVPIACAKIYGNPRAHGIGVSSWRLGG
jgi:hypothetical protein